tara:strand:- start:1629 stop:2141 length:513 start_codon:yes stop_codon:yes gene_type:complete
MLKSIIISNEEINEIKIKNLTDDNIFKKCGYKNNNNFKKLYDWEFTNSITLELWGKEKLKKLESKFSIFSKYNIKTTGKTLFLLRDNNENKFKPLSLTEFSNFFKLNNIEFENHDEETIESNIEVNSKILNQKILTDKEIYEKEQCDNESHSSLNSELTLDLYCYSDENN